MLSLICLKCFWRRMGKWPMLTFFETLMNENMKKRLLRHLKTVAYRQETWYRFSVWHFVFSKSWRKLFLANRVQFFILISKKLRSSFGLIIIDSGFPSNQKLRSNFYPNFPKKERQIIINLFCLLFLSLRRGKSFRPISFCSRPPQSVVERLQLFIFKPVSTFIVQSSTKALFPKEVPFCFS